MRFRKLTALALMFAVLPVTPAIAGWKLVLAQVPFSSGMKIIPKTDWNLASGKLGNQTTVWTHDGLDLNALEFFSGIPSGQPLYKDRNKKNPLPKFDQSMLMPDLVELFERTYRARSGISDFTVDETTPATFLGAKAIRARFHYTLPDDPLVRSGEVRLAIVNSKLYAIAFTAPRLHFFDTGLPEVTAIMDGATL